jgi:hypothetical protein
MAASVYTITNNSKQVIPILVGSIPASKAADSSDVQARVGSQVSVAPGSTLTIEKIRVDIGQLDALRNRGLITYV